MNPNYTATFQGHPTFPQGHCNNQPEANYVTEADLARIMQGNGILMDSSQNTIVELIEDTSQEGLTDGEQGEGNRIFIYEEGSPSDLTSKRPDMAVWNNETGYYELVTTENPNFRDFKTHIIEIMDEYSEDEENEQQESNPIEEHNTTIDHEACAAVGLQQFQFCKSEEAGSSGGSNVNLVTPCQIKKEVVPTSTTTHEDMLMDWSAAGSKNNGRNVTYFHSQVPKNESHQGVCDDSGFMDQSVNDVSMEQRMKSGDEEGEQEDKDGIGASSRMIQLETATGRIIQLPGEGEEGECVKKGKEVENMSVSEEEEEGTATDLPFACTLCKKRFSRKLHLNNHMERHHGIKFVFTEKGRKVKLVRIPEGFKIVEGEKLDPCVEKLIKTINKEKLHSIIGVEEIEPEEGEQGPIGSSSLRQTSNPDVDDKEDAKRYSDLLAGKIKAPFGCGFLFRKINYEAYRTAKTKGETPFAAFYPPDDDTKTYLFRLLDAGDKQHLLFPATRRDVKNAMGAKKDGDASYIIPLVAALKMNEEENQAKVTLEPLPETKPSKVEILAFDKFLCYARKCQPTKIKSLASSIIISPIHAQPPIVVDGAPKPRKKFHKRTNRVAAKENRPSSNVLCTSSEICTPLSHFSAGRRGVATTKLQKLRRNLQKEFEELEEDEDDEEKDKSYYPNASKTTGQKRGRGRPPGTKNKPRL